MNSYKDLLVWQKSMRLVEEIYRITKHFPDDEKFGLISQLRRCSVSIPSNIAEGRYRGTRKDYHRFLRIAYGSGAELETQLELVSRLEFAPASQIKGLNQLLQEVMKMLNVLMHKISIPSNQGLKSIT